MIPSATIRGRDPISLAKTVMTLGIGAMKALRLMRRIRPVAVVGFGGYPTLPPVLAATLRRIPTVIHDANAVMGRANKMLAPRVNAIATSFPNMTLDARARRQGDVHRQSDTADGACGRRRSPIRLPMRRPVPRARDRRQPGRARDGRCGAARGREDDARSARAARHRAAGARRGREARGARPMRGSASKPRSRRSSPTCRRASRRRT